MHNATASGDRKGFTATKGAGDGELASRYFAMAKAGGGDTTAWRVRRTGPPMCERKGRPIFMSGENSAFRRQCILSGKRATCLPNKMWLRENPDNPEEVMDFQCTLCLRPMGDKAPWFVPTRKSKYTLSAEDDVPPSKVGEKVELFHMHPLPFDCVGCASTWIHLQKERRQDAVAQWFSLLMELVKLAPPPGFDPEDPKPLPTLNLPGEFLASGRSWEEWDKLAWTYSVPRDMWATHVRTLSASDSGYAEIIMDTHYVLTESLVTDGTDRVVCPVVEAKPVTSEGQKEAILEEQHIAETSDRLVPLALQGDGKKTQADVAESVVASAAETQRIRVPAAKRFNPPETASMVSVIPEPAKDLHFKQADGSLRSADGRLVTRKEVEVRGRVTQEERAADIEGLQQKFAEFDEDMETAIAASGAEKLARDEGKKQVRAREKPKVAARNRQMCGRRKKSDNVLVDLTGAGTAGAGGGEEGEGGGDDHIPQADAKRRKKRVKATAASSEGESKAAEDVDVEMAGTGAAMPAHALMEFLSRKKIWWQGEKIPIAQCDPVMNEANVRIMHPDLDLGNMLLMRVARSSKAKGGAKIVVEFQGMACTVPCVKAPQFFTKTCMRLQDRAVAVLHHVLSCFAQHPDAGVEDVLPGITFNTVVMDHSMTVNDILNRAPAWQERGWKNNKGTAIPQSEQWENIMNWIKEHGIQIQALDL